MNTEKLNEIIAFITALYLIAANSRKRYIRLTADDLKVILDGLKELK